MGQANRLTLRQSGYGSCSTAIPGHPACRWHVARPGPPTWQSLLKHLPTIIASGVVAALLVGLLGTACFRLPARTVARGQPCPAQILVPEGVCPPLRSSRMSETTPLGLAIRYQRPTVLQRRLPAPSHASLVGAPTLLRGVFRWRSRPTTPEWANLEPFGGLPRSASLSSSRTASEEKQLLASAT